MVRPMDAVLSVLKSYIGLNGNKRDMGHQGVTHALQATSNAARHPPYLEGPTDVDNLRYMCSRRTYLRPRINKLLSTGADFE